MPVFVENPTWIHTFLVARPGSWEPVIIKSDIPAPTNEVEENDLIERIAQGVNTPPQFVKLLSSRCWSSQPFEDESARPSTLITPPKGLIVPNGVN